MRYIIDCGHIRGTVVNNAYKWLMTVSCKSYEHLSIDFLSILIF